MIELTEVRYNGTETPISVEASTITLVRQCARDPKKRIFHVGGDGTPGSRTGFMYYVSETYDEIMSMIAKSKKGDE